MYGTKKKEDKLKLLIKSFKAHGRYELASKYEKELEIHKMKRIKGKYIKPSNKFV